MPPLDHPTYLGHLATESARFLDVSQRTDPDLPVPACPDWSARDLVTHVAELLEVWTWSLQHRPADIEDYGEHAPCREWPETLSRLTGARNAFLEEIASADPSEVCLCDAVSGDTSVTQAAASLAHELLVHRVDAEQTLGSVTGLEPRFAAAGVEEMLRRLPPDGHWTDRPSTIRFRCTDTGDEVWTRYESYDFDDGGDLLVIPAPSPREPDVDFAGQADELLLWMWWRNRDDSTICISGDPALVMPARDFLGHHWAPDPRSRPRLWRRLAKALWDGTAHA